MCKEGKKEGKRYPHQLPNTDTDFCGYVRAKDFSAYVEGRKEIILLNYLLWLQITITRLVVALDSSLDISFFFFFFLLILGLGLSQSLILCLQLPPLYLF